MRMMASPASMPQGTILMRSMAATPYPRGTIESYNPTCEATLYDRHPPGPIDHYDPTCEDTSYERSRAPAAPPPPMSSAPMPAKSQRPWHSRFASKAMRQGSSESPPPDASAGDDEAEDAVSDMSQLEAIVHLQKFEGSWDWTDALFSHVKFDRVKLADLKKGEDQSGNDLFAAKSALLATALVLAFLEAKLVGRRDEWGMLADKALEWMAKQIDARGGSLSAKEFVEMLAEEVM